MKCPNCGHTQADETTDCESCQIVFSKWKQVQGRANPAYVPVPQEPAERPDEGSNFGEFLLNAFYLALFAGAAYACFLSKDTLYMVIRGQMDEASYQYDTGQQARYQDLVVADAKVSPKAGRGLIQKLKKIAAKRRRAKKQNNPIEPRGG